MPEPAAALDQWLWDAVSHYISRWFELSSAAETENKYPAFGLAWV